jgi:hypothetical protein
MATPRPFGSDSVTFIFAPAVTWRGSEKSRFYNTLHLHTRLSLATEELYRWYIANVGFGDISCPFGTVISPVSTVG